MWFKYENQCLGSLSLSPQHTHTHTIYIYIHIYLLSNEVDELA